MSSGLKIEVYLAPSIAKDQQISRSSVCCWCL